MTDPRFAGARIPHPPLADDDGSTPPSLAAALAASAAGRDGGGRVLAALAASRLLVPVVAVLEEGETGPDGLRRDKRSSMATVLVQGDGRRSLLAFSGTMSLTAWQDDARPVPLAGPLAARAAVDEGADALLVDVAGPVPFAVTGAELLLLAAVARPAGEPASDPVVRAAVTRALADVPAVHPSLASAHLDPEPDGGARLVLVSHARLPAEALEPLAHRLRDDRTLAHLLPGGLRLAVVAVDAAPDTPDVLRPSRLAARHHNPHG